MVEFGLAIAFGSLAAIAVGALWRARGWPDRWPLALVLAIAGVVAAGVAAERDPGVTSQDFALGVAIAAVGLAAIPLAGYYALGRLTGNRVLLAAVWLVSLAPLGFYLLVVALASTGLVSCPDGANDCPV